MGKKSQNDIDLDIGQKSRYDALERAEKLMRNRNEAELARAQRRGGEEYPSREDVFDRPREKASGEKKASDGKSAAEKNVSRKNENGKSSRENREGTKERKGQEASPVRKKSPNGGDAQKKKANAGAKKTVPGKTGEAGKSSGKKNTPEEKQNGAMKVRTVANGPETQKKAKDGNRSRKKGQDDPVQQKKDKELPENRKKKKNTAGNVPEDDRKKAKEESRRQNEKRRSTRSGMDAAPRSQVVDMSSKKRRKREKIRFALTAVGVVGVIALLLYVASAWFLFNVTEISVENNGKRYSDDLITEAAGISTESNLIRLSTAGAVRGIEDALPYIENAEVIKNWPNKITVRVEYSKAVISVRNGDSYVYLNAQGKVLENGAAAKAAGSALLSGARVVSCDPGKSVEFENEDCLETLREVAEAVRSNGIKKVTGYNIKNFADVSITVDGRITVKLGSVGNIAKKLAFGKVVIEKNMKDRTEERLVIDLTGDSKAFVRSAENASDVPETEEEAEENSAAPENTEETTAVGENAEETTAEPSAETTAPEETVPAETTAAEGNTTQTAVEFG